MQRVTLRILSGPVDAIEGEDTGQPWPHYRYTVELHYDGRRETFPWKQGTGITEDPKASEVLEAILSDCASYDNARSFEEWAPDYGYDPDSRRAESIYREVGEQREKVARLLGEAYDAAVFPPFNDAEPYASSEDTARALADDDEHQEQDDDDATTYEVRRLYADSSHPEHRKLIRSGLTLEEAQSHCQREDTHEPGEWFDGYEAE